jgi:DNA-binding CsgD family transcriptional regulator
VERNADCKTPRQLYELLHLKSEIAAQQRDWEKAHKWLQEADQVGAIWQDSLRSSQFADFAAQYHSSSLKKEVVSLSEELFDRTRELRSNQIITFTLCGLLLGSLGVAFLFLFNLRKARKLAIEEKALREESKQVAAQKMALLEDELSKKEEKLHFTLTQQLHIRQLFEEAVAFAQNTSGDQDRFLNHLQVEQERLRALRQSQDLETELNEQLPVFMARLNERAQEPLTPYEKAVAALIRSGYTTKDIAALLDKSVRAIDNARYRIRQKLALNRTDHLQSYLEAIGNR